MADDNTDPAYMIRTVDQLIRTLNDGDDCAEAGRCYDEIMDRLATLRQDHPDVEHKASLTLTLEFIQDGRGLDVKMASKVKISGPPVLKERFFTTAKSNYLTRQDPGRGSMFPGIDMGRKPGRRAGSHSRSPDDESA